MVDMFFQQAQLSQDLRHFMIDKGGIDRSVTDDIQYRMQNAIMPSVIEERQLHGNVISLWDRMLYDRIIYLSGEITELSCNIAISQLLWLASTGKNDINMFIASPGGECMAGMALCDTMDYIQPNVNTTCIGRAASMGAVLLSCGAKGNRAILPNSAVMIHSVSGGFHGKFADNKRELEVMTECQRRIFTILAKNCGKTYEEIEEIGRQPDFWLWGDEAIKFGIADKILEKAE